MRTVGIICELNPPHTGHRLLFDSVGSEYPGSAVIAVMSGNFVQRGEPAVYAKHQRAAAALRHGADLVIELPAPYAVSSAEGFAASAVSLLIATGITDTLAFGCECGELTALKTAADALNSEECEEKTRGHLTKGASYARARQAALTEIIGSGADVLTSPNNLLGIEYLRAVQSLRANFDYFCVKREPGVSASGLRKSLENGGDTSDILPCGALPYGEAVFPKMTEQAALSRLRILPENAFFHTPGGADGVAERALSACRSGAGLDEIAFAVKSKRHTLSRVRRYILSLVLGITDDLPELPPYIRVLGTNRRGRELLKKAECALPVITKPADGRKLGGEAARVLELEARATDFYNLARSDEKLRRGGAEWRISPVTF